MSGNEQKIIQVVKRFGPCGGMEEYVFRLCNSLTDFGYKVLVLCEKKINLPESCNIEIIQLGEGISKPRWISHVNFSRKVATWLQSNVCCKYLVHSHERVSSHHVTTIHSTLFNFPFRVGFPSLRKFINEKLEKREINENSVRCVVPVSNVIAEQIKKKYPRSVTKLSTPINPGIDKLNFKKPDRAKHKLVKVGFMGQEWKRKGLPKVIKIWRSLARKDVNCQLVLAGFPSTENIGLSNAEMGRVKILGWLKDKSLFYSNIDILLHPAKREAYGMVIAESASLGIPFLCSSECGASILANEGYGRAIPECSSIEAWVEQLMSALDQDNLGKAYERSWSQVAKEYSKLYEIIDCSPHPKLIAR